MVNESSTKRTTLSVQNRRSLSTGMSKRLTSSECYEPTGRLARHPVSPRNAMPVLWLTGLPAAGKSTIAALTAQRLIDNGISVEVLDGDEIRKAISPSLGFS